MKKFLIGILTFLLTITLFLFLLVSNIKTSLTSTISNVFQQELVNNVTKYVEENIELPEKIEKEKLEEGFDKILEKTDGVQPIFESYIDRFIKVIGGEQTEEINITKEIDNILEQSEGLLEEYNVQIPEEEKKKFYDYIEEQNLNQKLNDSITQIQASVPSEIKSALKTYNFIQSKTFKRMLIGTILVLLVLIAILKKSYYKWLSNLGFVGILNGVLIGIFLPMVIQYAGNKLTSDHLISTVSFSNCGYTLLFIGVFCIVINVVITKLLEKKKQEKLEV